MEQTIAYYIRFLTNSGTPVFQRFFQNFHVGQVRNWEGFAYRFAPFAISGDLASEGGLNGEGELIAPANLLTGSVLWESSSGRYLLEIKTVLIAATQPEEPDGLVTWEETLTVSQDVMVCDGLAYTDAVPGEEEAVAVLSLKLTNPLNAVTGIAPTRRLRDDQVGALPSSGGITF
jgi:hypothetical protein